jgi:hypothetical protein
VAQQQPQKLARGYADPRVPESMRAELARTRPPVKGEHEARFRNPGPGTFKAELGGVVPYHCHARKVFCVRESAIGEAFAAGLEWVGWAAA